MNRINQITNQTPAIENSFFSVNLIIYIFIRSDFRMCLVFPASANVFKEHCFCNTLKDGFEKYLEQLLMNDCSEQFGNWLVWSFRWFKFNWSRQNSRAMCSLLLWILQFQWLRPKWNLIVRLPYLRRLPSDPDSFELIFDWYG